uniref:Putative tick transposon n=1 Tax=Rhipicephalus pulchellus TaxID=72859 RepID=L7LVB7_RHIPC
MLPYQLAQIAVLVQFISSSRATFPIFNQVLHDPAYLAATIALCECQARVATWHIRRGTCPEQLLAMCGWFRPTVGHTRRMCRILRSEWMSQARLLRDCLKATCGFQRGRHRQCRMYEDWSRTSQSTLDFLWSTVRRGLPTREKTPTPTGKVINLTDTTVPDKHLDILKLGPKFCMEPDLKPVEKLATVRSVTKHVEEAERARCVSECIDVLCKSQDRHSGNGRTCRIQPVVQFLRDNKFKLMTADKEGFFVLLNEQQYSEKASVALGKNFKEVVVDPKKVKEKAKKLLQEMNLDRLSRGVAQTKKHSLDIFFTIKTHKPELPFRTVVSERNTWQHVVSGYLQKHLTKLHIVDPFRVKNSDDVVAFLRRGELRCCTALSVDVTDLYYSLPQEQLMSSVKECIAENDELKFRNESGVPVQSFLELLSFYVQSTFLLWDEKVLIQRQGVCIGSQVAPVLSEIYLGKVDRTLEGTLTAGIVKIFRFVDDYLVITRSHNRSGEVNTIVSSFQEGGLGLAFTYELPSNKNEIQFLDLKLRFSPQHICWEYNPRSRKPILHFSSAHSKLVKRGIAATCLGSALRKSCHHVAKFSFSRQLDRLKEAGFPMATVISVCEGLLKKFKKGNQQEQGHREKKKDKIAVIPYAHRMAHGLKKVASKYQVQVIFSAKNRLSSLCPLANKPKRMPIASCQPKHTRKFVPCSSGVVYAIPLSCGKVYYGQTGRCLNIRLREHYSAVKNSTTSNLATHCSRCKCEPLFEETAVLYKNKDQTSREIVEAYHMHVDTARCVSQTSISLHEKEIEFLNGMFPRISCLSGNHHVT